MLVAYCLWRALILRTLDIRGIVLETKEILETTVVLSITMTSSFVTPSNMKA